MEADFFSSVALASELLCEPGDEYVNNVRSLWSSLAPGNQVFAAGIDSWEPVDRMLDGWFTSKDTSLEFAHFRHVRAFSDTASGAPSDELAKLRGKVEAISELLYNIAPLYARESFLSLVARLRMRSPVRANAPR